MRIVAALLLIALTVYCVADILRSEDDERLGAPPFLWVLLVVLIPFFGSVAWLLVSRGQRSGRVQDVPRVRPRRGLGRPGFGQEPRALGPDDDPDFLRRLDRERDRRRRDEGGA
jgi:hypothetical protein